MTKKLLLVTIGTSLLEKKITLDRRLFDPENLDDAFFNGFPYDNYKNNSYLINNPDKISDFVQTADSLNIINELNKRGQDCKDYKGDPDLFPAEISSILLFLQDEKYFEYQNNPIIIKRKDVSYDIHFLISGTDRCKFCARAIQYYFNKKINVGAVLFIPDENLHIIDKLSENSAEFNDGLQTLLTTINETTKNTGVYQEIIFNITAGYKGVIPYMVLAGMCYKNSRIIYLYETSKSIIEIPKLPLNFDIAGWNDNRAFLRILAKTSQVQKIYTTKELLPISEEFRSLFVLSKDSISFTPFGNFLQEKYEKAKEEKSLSEFGRGYILADLIQDEAKKRKLKAWINNSQNIWYGDNIPETVDHSRGHCQRLLELAAQILSPIQSLTDAPFLSDDEIIVLNIILWFHDIGHAGREMIRNFSDSTVTKLLEGGAISEEGCLDISDFPTVNRDLHHILGFIEVMKDRENYGFCQGNGKKTGFLDVAYLKPAIYAYLYHRKKMPKINGDAEFKFEIFNVSIRTPIPENWSINDYRGNIRLRFLAALQAFIDECDNSRERVGDDEFRKRRTRQTRREIKTEYGKLKNLYKKCCLTPNEFESLIQLFQDNGNFYDFDRLLEQCKDLTLKKEIGKEDKKSTIEAILNDLLKKCYNNGEEVDLLFTEMAKTLHKVIFKLIQNVHFEKSVAYEAVFILPHGSFNKNNYCFNIHMEKSREENADGQETQAINDIKEQYFKVKTILGEREISFNSIIVMDGKGCADPEVLPCVPAQDDKQ